MSTILIARVSDTFATALHVSAPRSDQDLIEDGLLDSLALIELLVAIEEEFQIELPLDELEIDRFRTIEQISALVASILDRGDAS